MVSVKFSMHRYLSFQGRIKQKNWILKHYGLKPILTGFSNEDIWHAFPRIYRLHERDQDGVGIHCCVDFEEFKLLVSEAQTLDSEALTQARVFIALVLDKAFYKQGSDLDKTRIEKTPMHIRHANTILSSFPEAKVIEVIRDVRDVVASWRTCAKKARWAQHQTTNIIKQWLRCITLGEKYKANRDFKDRIFRIKYEDLRDDTFLNLSNILNFVGLSVDSQTIEKILDRTDISKASRKGEGEHVRKGIVGSWKNELSESDITLCHELAGTTLIKLGYSAP